MSKGDELFALRENLLDYLYDEGALSPRVAVPSEKTLSVLQASVSEYMSICDSLKQDGFINGTIVEEEPVYTAVWLTGAGLNHVHWHRNLAAASDTTVTVLKERLQALLEMKQIIYRRLNMLEIHAARQGLSHDALLDGEINDVKAQIARVDEEIDDVKARIAKADEEVTAMT